MRYIRESVSLTACAARTRTSGTGATPISREAICKVLATLVEFLLLSFFHYRHPFLNNRDFIQHNVAKGAPPFDIHQSSVLATHCHSQPDNPGLSIKIAPQWRLPSY